MLGSSSVCACACAFCFVLVHLFPLDCTCRGGSRGGGRLVRGGKLASLLEAVGLSFAEVGRLLGWGRRHISTIDCQVSRVQRVSRSYPQRLGRVAGISARSIVRFLGFRGSLGLTHSVWVVSQGYRHGRLSGLSGSCLGGGFRGSLCLTHSVWVGSGRVIEVGLGSGGYYQRWR